MSKDLYVAVTTTAEILANPENINHITNDDSQLLYGEIFAIEEKDGEWLKGQSLVDGYAGYVHEDSLAKQVQDASHFVDVRLIQSYAEPNFKTRPLGDLSFLSRLSALDEKENGFLETSCGWVFEDHLKPMKDMQNQDILQTALLFLNTPYLYGGRSSLGIDCSGLVQLALMRNGIECPRDSSEQSKIGETIELGAHKAGDLIFFPGHVGIFTSENEIINATARTMDTRVETLDKLLNDYSEITTIKRITA